MIPLDPLDPLVDPDDATVVVSNSAEEEQDALFDAMDVDNATPDFDEKDDVIADKMPPLYSFGDKALFNQQLEEKGIEGVTRDVVQMAKAQLSHLNFTYDDLRDGSADVLDYIRPENELPTQTRAMTDEAILALFTDLEDYGKYDPPKQKRNDDGTLAFDEQGAPINESQSYNLSAIAGGGKRAAVPAGFMAIGGWQGARLGAAAYASRVPQTGARPLDVGGKAVAATLGAVVGSGVLTYPAAVINEWLFEEPDPIVVPSLQAAYNAGQSTAYGISFLASPWVGTKLAAKPLNEIFNSAKTLQQFKSVASSKYSPDEATAIYGKALVDAAFKARVKQDAKGTIRKRVTPDLTKGPTAMRITDTLTRGGEKAMQYGRDNPASFLGMESVAAVGFGAAAYQAEKLFPGNEFARFAGELISPVPSIMVVKAVTGTTRAAYNVAKSALSGDLLTQAGGLRSEKLRLEAGQRISDELRDSPEFTGMGDDSEQALSEALDALLMFRDVGKTASRVLGDADSPLAPAVERIESQLSTRSQELSVATEQGREQFIADSKEAILKLRETNTPEGMQLAASIEQRVVEEEVIDQLEIANTNFVAATTRLFGNESDAPQDAELGKRFFDLQLRMVAGLKAQRDQLWKQVPDFDVRTFSLKDGTKVKQPNSLTIFNIPVKEGGLKFSSLGGEAEFNTILGKYKDDFALMDEYFNPSGQTDADGNFVAGAFDNVPDFPVQFSRLREMYSHFKGLKADREKNNVMDPMASHIGSLIKALDQDMNGMDADGIFLTPEGKIVPIKEFNRQQSSIVQAYLKAKSYTYGMHNVISRTFISDFSKQNSARGMVLDPLDAVDAVKKGDDIPLSRLNQMQNAADFITAKNITVRNVEQPLEDITRISYLNKSTGQQFKDVPYDSEAVSLELNEILELIIRDARKNIMVNTKDPLTGETIRKVDLKKLQQYKDRANSEELFAIFPGLARDLDSAESAQVLMNQTLVNKKALQNSVEQKAFNLFLDRPESGSKVIAQIMAGEKKIPTEKALQLMVDKIKNRGSYINQETKEEFTSAQVLDGLRASIMNYGIVKSGGSGFNFSPTKMYDTLFADAAMVDATGPGGGFKLMDFMKRNGMVDTAYVENFQKALNQMRNVEAGIANNELSGNLFKRPSAAKIAMLRIGGAMAMGASLQRVKGVLGKFGLSDFGSGGGYVAGGEGAKTGESLFITGPETIVITTMTKIMNDPKMLALAVKEASTAQELAENLNALQKMLGAQVVRQLPKVERDVSADESFVRPGTLGDTPVDTTKAKTALPLPELTQPPAQEVTQLQGPTPPPTPAPAPVAPTTAPNTGPVDRSRFAAMFPNDIASGLINQGIGSIPA